MEKDLRLDSSQFEWLLRVFYIMYIAFEWMTLLWKIFPAHIYRKNPLLQKNWARLVLTTIQSLFVSALGA